MADVVYITSGLRGMLYGAMGLSRRLEADGHRVTLVSSRDIAADAAAGEFDHVKVAVFDDEGQAFTNAVTRQGRFRSLAAGVRSRRRLLDTSIIEDTVRQLGAELLIIDVELHHAILATRKLNVPTSLVLPWFPHDRSLDIPPMHTSLTPPSSFGAGFAIRAEWGKLIGRRALQRTVGQLSRRSLRDHTTPFDVNTPSIANIRALARRHDVDLRSQSRWTDWIEPLSYPNITQLSLTIAEMDFLPRRPTPERPGRATHIGPMIEPSRPEPFVTDKARADFSRFSQAADREGNPIIYASMGSMLAPDSAFFGAIIAALRQRPDWRLVIGLGQAVPGRHLLETPSNVLVLDYAPQLDVLKTAAAAIHLGGIGTTNECAWFGVPSLVCSGGHVDQNGNAARIEFHQLGTRFDPLNATTDALISALQHVIADPGIRRGVRTTQATMGRYVSERRAERAIERVLSGDAR